MLERGFYVLTHIDGQPIPLSLPMNGANYLVTSGDLQIEPPNDLGRQLDLGDGALTWSLSGRRSPDSAPGPVMMARHWYRLVEPGVIRFPCDPSGAPSEYSAQVSPEEVVLRVSTARDRPYSPARLLGGDRTWRFSAAHNKDPGPRFRIEGRQSRIVEDQYRGRTRRWLTRLANWLFGH